MKNYPACKEFMFVFVFQKGLVDFYENGKPREEKKGKNGDMGWGMVLGCLGAVAIGAMIVNKA